MTTQPKLPEWAEQFVSERKVRGFDLDPDTFHLTTEDARALASRLLAEIAPTDCPYCSGQPEPKFVFVERDGRTVRERNPRYVEEAPKQAEGGGKP